MSLPETGKEKKRFTPRAWINVAGIAGVFVTGAVFAIIKPGPLSPDPKPNPAATAAPFPPEAIASPDTLLKSPEGQKAQQSLNHAAETIGRDYLARINSGVDSGGIHREPVGSSQLKKSLFLYNDHYRFDFSVVGDEVNGDIDPDTIDKFDFSEQSVDLYNSVDLKVSFAEGQAGNWSFTQDSGGLHFDSATATPGEVREHLAIVNDIAPMVILELNGQENQLNGS